MSESQLDRIERNMIRQEEIKSLGHRIIYNTRTGESENIIGMRIDPKCLDKNGLQIRFEDTDVI